MTGRLVNATRLLSEMKVHSDAIKHIVEQGFDGNFELTAGCYHRLFRLGQLMIESSVTAVF